MADMASGMARLVVRSPSVATRDDFGVWVPLGGRISDVKAAIERGHEASPPAHGMRLIWKGRILEDEDPVARMYESGLAADTQTVHFVLSTPATYTVPAAGASRRPASSSSSSSSCGHDDSANQGGLPVAAGRGAEMVPLSSQFQYVLVDGVPYLWALPAGAGAGTDGHSTRPAAAVEQQEDDSDRVRRQMIDDALESDRASRQMVDDARERVREIQQIQERLLGGRQGNRGVAMGENGVPFMDMLRGAGLGQVWSFVWLLLRMLLVVLLFAHDTPLPRLLMFAFIITAATLIIQVVWEFRRIDQIEQDLANYRAQYVQQPPPDGPPAERQYSALQKAWALLAALVTSLVPAEPLPAGDA
ncbi:hypothetical protein H4R19_003016 [Coemansia spiralis]|nr:hypothetical protein H4R19_003016 [Coemansia spiralis]